MENRRFMLIAALGVILFLIYQTWQQDHPLTPSASRAPVSAPAAATPAAAVTPPAGSGSTALPEATAPAASGARIHVRTDVLSAEISLGGGELRRLELLDYPLAKDQPNQPLSLLDDRDGQWFVLQSGLATPQKTLTGPDTPYTSAQTDYRLAPGQDSLDVPLDYVDAGGYRVRKVYRFKRGSYEIGLDQQVSNTGAAALDVSPYVRLWQVPPEKKSSGMPFGGIHTFSGVAWYEQKPGSENYRFRKDSFDELRKEPLDLQQKGGWLAMLQHYFIAAIIPPAAEQHQISGRPSSSAGDLAQYVGAAASVAPQAAHDYVTQLYLGPVLQKTIGSVAPGLDLAIDYGLLSPVAHLLFWVMNFFHQLTHNWGAAIVLLTLLVRGLMYPLSEKQYRSMAKMKKFGPRIQELKERYADDRERMSKAMMELYKKEGFNPLAGCWPLLIQFPVFLALYWVLLDSVELRQAPFMFWLNDLSAADPYFVLPVLFGISMFVQQRLSGTQVADPMQQRVMQMMPILMAAFFAFFPSGLVLYYIVSNLTGITQQWLINRKLEKEGLGRSAR